MKLTRENLHPKGFVHQGYNRHQLAILGVSLPVEKGWLSKLVGKEISETDYAEFVRLGTATRREQKKSHPATRPPRDYPDLFAVESPEDFANELFTENDGDLN